MRFQHRGGRKRIVAPDGSEIAPSSKPQPDGTLVKALARAWRWQRMLDEGVYTSVSEIGDAENISKSYVSRILRLALLAPDIVEAILAGRTDQALMLEQLERPLPASWEEQRHHQLERVRQGPSTRLATPLAWSGPDVAPGRRMLGQGTPSTPGPKDAKMQGKRACPLLVPGGSLGPVPIRG